MKGRLFYVPIDVATQPVEGHVYINRWWCVHPERGVAFYCRERPAYVSTPEASPQCNRDRSVVEHINEGRPGHEARLVPAVYAAHAEKYQRASREDSEAP